MATYKYTAVSRDGKRVSGVIEGYNEMDAATKLKESYSIVIQLSETKKGGAASFLSGDIGGKKLNSKQFTLMCSQFAVILRAGIPIGRTVELIADKMTDKTLKRILVDVAEDVKAGRSLSASFADRGKDIFPITFLETIHAGEESGNLDTAFESVAKQYDKQNKIRAKVRGAMIYPAFVLIIAIVVVIVLMVRVVPVFTEIFDSYDAELPGITKALIAMSDFFAKYWMILLAVAIVIYFAFKIYGKTEAGRINLAKLQLKLPILGNIAVLNGASQFANTMAMMLHAGLPMTNSVSITGRVLDNYYMSQKISRISGKLEEGRTLGRSLRDAECMPDILVDMTSVGEESGELAQTLDMTADYYDNELEQAVQSALAKLEPAVLVFLAAFAGFIVIAVYIAMFDMYAAM